MKILHPRLVWGATLFSTPGMKPNGSHLPLVLSLVIFFALLVVCLGLCLRSSKRQPPDTDPGDGWGRRRPKPPPARPHGPRGGIPIPLSDAMQSRARLRGPSRFGETFGRRSPRPARGPSPAHRPAPARRPVRIS